MVHEVNSADSAAKAVDGLLGFAQGILTAREKVQMVMQAGLGVFSEDAMRDLPGIDLDAEDGAWMRIARLRESAPPQPPEHVAVFLSGAPNDPSKPPMFMEAIATEVSIEEAYGTALQMQSVAFYKKGNAPRRARFNVVLLRAC